MRDLVEQFKSTVVACRSIRLSRKSRNSLAAVISGLGVAFAIVVGDVAAAPSCSGLKEPKARADALTSPDPAAGERYLACFPYGDGSLPVRSRLRELKSASDCQKAMASRDLNALRRFVIENSGSDCARQVLSRISEVEAKERSTNFDPSKLTFLGSGLWHQYKKDISGGFFRMYAVAMDDRNQVVDMPNIIFLTCGPHLSYLTFHFPEKYVFRSFTPTEWIPETFLYARVNSGTYKFKAELNKNEIYVDLPGNEDHLNDILRADVLALRFGPNASDQVVFSFNNSLKDAEINLLNDPNLNGGRGIVQRSYAWNEIATCIRR